jgi:hypothetical protein
MARSQTLGDNIPLIRRIQRYSAMATLFRSFVGSEYQSSAYGQGLVGSTSEPDDSNVVKATLLPSGNSLPVGAIVPTAGFTPTAQRAVQAPPPIQREVSAPPVAPVQDFVTAPTPPAVQEEPATPPARVVSSPQAAGDSTISDSDWNRLRTVMRGHQEKMVREKETPEYIQRQKEKAEQEAAKQKADAKTKRRQDLARAGKLPKAQVVYLSPEDQASSPIADRDVEKVAYQPPVDQIDEGPEVIELPEVEADAVELTTGSDIPPAPAPIQSSDEVTHPKPDSAKRTVQLSPGADAPPAPQRASEPKATEAPIEQPFDQVEEAPEEEFYQPQEQLEIEPTPDAQQESKETVEKVPFVESTPEFDTAKPRDMPAAKMSQLEPEAAVQPPSQEPKSPGQTDGEPKTEEKTTLGQRFLDAARSLFRRQDEPAPIPEPTISLTADEKISREEVEEEISEQSSVEMPPETEDIQIPGRPFEIGKQESKPQDTSIATPVEQPAQPVIQRAKDQPAIEVRESSVIGEPAKPETERVEVEYADQLAGEPPLVSETEAASEDISQAGQPVDVPEEAIIQAVEETDLESPPEKPEPAAKIEPTAPAPTISRKPDTAQSEAHKEKPAEVQQKSEVTSSVPPAPQTEIETGKIDQDDSYREPDMGIPAPVTTASGDVEDVNLRETVKAEGFGPEPDQASDISEDVSSDRIQLTAAIDSDEGESAVQELPLQEVWPAKEATPSPLSVVTRKPSAETEGQESPIDEGDLPTLVIQAPVEEDAGSEAELRSTLEEVSPGKPTDSSIELLPPRRPRPQIAPVQRSEELVDSGSTPIQDRTKEEEPVIQDMPDVLEKPKAVELSAKPIQLHEEETVSRKAATSSDRPDVDSLGEIQHEPALGPVPEAGFVQTEIGALPGDLWEYLGEKTPESPAPTTPELTKPAPKTPAPESPAPRTREPAAPASSTQAQAVRSESIPPAITAPVPTPLQTYADPPPADLALDTVQRTETKSETSTPVLDFQTPLQPLGLESALDWIQRTDDPAAEADITGGEFEEAELSEVDEVDIEDLARKILPIIKRKLSIEWERSRGRF